MNSSLYSNYNKIAHNVLFFPTERERLSLPYLTVQTSHFTAVLVGYLIVRRYPFMLISQFNHHVHTEVAGVDGRKT